MSTGDSADQRLSDGEYEPPPRPPEPDRRHHRWGHRLLKNAATLGPLALTFAVYSLLLDHLPSDWFAADWVRDGVAGVSALCIGLGLRVLLGTEAVQRRLGPPPSHATIRLPQPRTPLSDARAAKLSRILEATSRRLITDCRPGEHNGTATFGWSQFFGDAAHPSAIGTSYGVRLVLLLDIRDPRLDRGRLMQTLLTLERPDGGWRGRSQRGGGKPEVTAWVGTAAARLGLPPERRARLVGQLEQMTTQPGDSIGMARTTVVTSVICALAELAPQSPALEAAVDTLLNGVTGVDLDAAAGIGWGEVCGSARLSVPHTARAVVALAAAAPVLRGKGNALEQAGAAGIVWLRAHLELAMFEEQLIRRPAGDEADVLVIGHFTAAWVARALMTAGRDKTDVDALRTAIRQVVAAQENGVWRWQNTERQPLWMMYQGAQALRNFLLMGLHE
jgi:hypothetical protein